MSTDAIGSTYLSNQTSSTPTSSTSGYDLSEEDFLALLCSELEYQDPLDPQSNSEFASSIAQYTQVNTLSDINDNIETLAVLEASINSYQSLGFIGKTIDATGDAVDYDGDAIDLGFTLADDAASVKVTISDSDGKAVRTIDLGALSSGGQTGTWDGKDDNGSTVDQGTYTYKVVALDADGDAVKSSTETTGTVTGVTYDNGITYLMVGDRKILISDVTKIYE